MNDTHIDSSSGCAITSKAFLLPPVIQYNEVFADYTKEML